MSRITAVILTSTVGVLLAIGGARAANVGAGSDGFEVAANRAQQGSAIIFTPPSRVESASSSGATTGSTSNAVPAVRTEYRTACEFISDRASGCVSSADICPAGATSYREWVVTATSETPLGTVCLGGEEAVAAAAPPPPPQVTPAMVLAAFREVPVPELTSVTQPSETTLVNFETIFYAEAEAFTANLTLLGQSVRLEIAPTSFRWEHGDGTSSTTRGPGAAYPRKDVVYRYQEARVTVRHRVVVTWTAQWSLNDGPLQPVDGTVTTSGPFTPLRVAEAVPALSGQHTR